MASWSDVGASDGPQLPHGDGGADDYNGGDAGHGGDPWQDYNGFQDPPAGEGDGSLAGWSWTNNGKGGSDGHRERDPDNGSQDFGSTSSKRRRGKRGSGGKQSQQQPRWRSGQVPQPPEFDGDVETNPFCLRHYRRALRRWVRITKEFLPPNEQALRALDAMRGSAALEFEEVDDDRYDMENGIDILLADLEKNFGEKEIFRRGGVIREYETLTRVQGESITAFIRRFRLVERKLQDAQVAPYPDESRAIKFLDGLRLDEKTTSHILLAAGNKYNFQAILDAVRMQFPAGLTLTGMARPGATLSSSSSTPMKRGRGGRGKGRGWRLAYKSWNANEADEEGGQPEHGDDGHETWETAEHYEDEGLYDTFEEADPNGYIDVIYENDDAEAVDNAEEIEPEEQATQEILTATSKQMAGQKAARGYYDVSNKGKGKKSSKDGKNSKGRGSGPATYGYGQAKGKDSNKGKNKSGNEHKGKGYDGGGKSQRQIRFANSQCLGCGSTKHFLRDCPNVTTYQAHLASALAPGSLNESGEFQSWMVSGSGYGGASGSGDRLRLTGDEMRARSRSRDGSPPDDDPPGGNDGGSASGSTGPYVDQLPHVFSENDLFATDFQYTNTLHDVAFRRIIRDFERAVQPRQGQCTPERPHGHWVCPATLIDWKFDPEVVVNLSQPTPEWLSNTFNVFAAIDDDEEGLERQREAINRFQDDSWKGGWYTWEINGMAVVCCWNWHPERYVPLPLGFTRSQVCRYRSTWLVKRDGDLRWVHHEWNRSTTTIGWADEENFRGTFDTTRYKAAIHFFTAEYLGPFTVPHLRDQFTHMINYALYSKKKFLQSLIYYGETPRTVNRRPRTEIPDSDEEPEAEEEIFMVSEVSSPMYKQPSLTNLLSNADEPCCMILDTGCQRQVAGKEWHRVHQGHLDRLLPLEYPERASFRFGPEPAKESKRRWAYPCGISGHFCVLWISEVDVPAPALCSRHTMSALGAVVDVARGEVFFRGFNSASQLYLTSCGHLAIRIDEFPTTMPSWPLTPPVSSEYPPDCWAPAVQLVSNRVLDRAAHAPQVPDASSTAMASTMACAPDPHEHVHRPGDYDGEALQLNSFEGESTGQDPGNTSPVRSSFGDVVKLRSRGDEEGDGHRQLREGSIDLRSSQRSSELWSRRSVGEDLRHMRVSRSGDAQTFVTGGEIGGSDSKSNTNFQDSSTYATRRREGAKATLFKVILTIIAAAFGKSSTSSIVSGDTQVTGPSADEESSGALGGELWQPLADAADSTSSLGRSLRRDESGHRGGHAILGGRESLQLGRRRHGGRVLSGSADEPLTWEDRGSFTLKAGTKKSLLSNVRKMQELWKAEAKVLENTTNTSRKLRNCKADLVEIYAGAAHITEVASKAGLRTIEPVDQVYGIHMAKSGKQDIVNMVEARSPFMTVYEIECRLWGPLTNLNYHYRPEVLEALRKAERSAVSSMSRHCEKIYSEGRYFLIENPAHSQLWAEKSVRRLMDLPGVTDVVCDMCCFNLRGRHGGLMKKPTRWLSNCSEVIAMLSLRCSGDHEHEECMGPNTRLGQVYTYELAHAVVRGVQMALRGHFDERMLLVNDGGPSDEVPVLFTNEEHHNLAELYEIYYVDVDKDAEHWRPLLKEAKERLEGKVSTSAEVKKGTAFYEQISRLAPGWVLAYVQIYRAPKCRRLPTRRILEGEAPITHRAAALLNNDNMIEVESESVASLSASGTGAKFAKPCSYAIFIYGEAPATEFGEKNERAQPAASRTPRGVPVPATPGLPALEEMEQVPDRDITFEIDEGTVPKWVQGVLRRLHVNLGHPSNATLVRQLAQVSASQQALIGAKALRCTVCKQMQNIKPSAPSRMSAGRSFNEQVAMDFIYIHDVAGETHTILSIVDDASHYHVLQRMAGRTTEHVISALVNGWFRFFGPPENILLDAEGAMKSLDFQEMAAQAGCTMRFVPADAHWQLGRAERHGAVAKEIANRIIVQHGVQTAEEMEMVVTMAGFAKNQLIRRAGVAPSQWVFGRSPRIPGVLISEGARVEDKQMVSNSKKLQRTELMRLEAMKTFLEIDMSNRLRTAMLRKSRPFRGGFEIGQRLAYWRVRNTLDGEGPFAGYRQGVLIGMDPGPRGSLWIRNDRGRLVQVAREQARALEAEEAWMPGNSDFRLLRDAEQDLSEKHAVAQDQRQAAIEDADRPPLLALPEARPSLDVSGQPTASSSIPPIIVQPPQPLQLEQPPQQSPSLEPQQLDLPQQRPMEDTLAAGTKKSAGAGSLASAGEVPKRVKTQHPSQPPSRMGSSDATLVDPISIAEGSVAAGSAHMIPVPEDSVGSDSLANKRFDQSGQSDEKMVPEQAQGEQIFQVHAKAYCRLCGSVNKLVEAGVTRCGRCMNSTFTDDVDDVLNWFDEDEKFDGVCKRMTRDAFCVQEGLPVCDALRDVAASKQWLSSEVLMVERLDQVPLERHTSEKDYPVMSYAAWYGAEDMWLWGMVQNSPTEGGYSDVFFDEEKEVNPEH